MKPGAAHADEQGDLGSVAQHVANDPIMRLARLVADRFKSERAADALDNGRLPGAAAPDENVQIGIEAHGHAVEETAFPPDRNDFHVLVGRKLAFLGIQANARARVQEGLAQPVYGNLLHLDPAGRRGRLKVAGLHDVLCVDDSDRNAVFGCVITTVVGVPVLEDFANVRLQIVSDAGDLDGEEALIPPCADPRLTGQDLEEPTLVGDMRPNGNPALAVNGRQNLRKCLGGGLTGRGRLADAEFSKVTAELVVACIRRVQAQ